MSRLSLMDITERIRVRSADSRAHYLAQIAKIKARPDATQRSGCANLAHVTAGLPVADKKIFMAKKQPHLAIVTAYNEMLSAHQPYADYPPKLRAIAARLGATVQVAGGVPAMCDGITQGYEGMELSLFSRDVIAQSTAVALSHDVFDGALLLGICDKIVPGLLIGALHFGHLPCVFVPAGPMPSGLSHGDKTKIREKFVQGQVGKDALQAAEDATYHAPGTCTFYGTANSNQLLLEAMGLILPNTAFIPPYSQERDEANQNAVATLIDLCASRPLGIGELVDERVIVNAMVALLATGGSTNHLIHWIAVARAAGIVINWDDFADLSAMVPLITRIYPNGTADVNAFHHAGGVPAVLRTLADEGLIHHDVPAIHHKGLWGDWDKNALTSKDDSIIRTATHPFSATGGVKLLQGNLGRSVIKTSALPNEKVAFSAPARVFHTQEECQQAYSAGELNHDVVVVLRFQGPKANGMPELHKLTSPLATLQARGLKVLLLTDGRLSGASGKVPAAIHLYPEALEGGALARLRDGDLISINVPEGTLNVMVKERDFLSRPPALPPAPAEGFGRELFANFRACVTHPELGAKSW